MTASRMLNRRTVLAALGTVGIGTSAFRRSLSAQVADSGTLTAEILANAEWVAGIELTQDQRDRVVGALTGVREKIRQLRQVPIDYDILPAVRFDPELVDAESKTRSAKSPKWLAEKKRTAGPSSDVESLSFLSIDELGRRLRDGQLTSVQLTQHCLDRLNTHAAELKCLVTLTDDLALQLAARADAELQSGHDRGPLHGIPWGAKDLIDVAGYPATWGAPQFRDRVPVQTATVAQHLESAGAVLVAKLSLGALAMGDRWYEGQTRNPWNPEQGSSGSSAGSASAVAAGLVPFALGSETLGSIVSPSRRCGTAALRPTFGRVSRSGCMALSWTMDKIGPIARTIDDCGLVFDAIHGADPDDPTSVDRWFRWPVSVDLSRIRIGRVVGVPANDQDETILNVLRDHQAEIVDVELPHDMHEWAIATMLDVEAATVFHQLVAQNDTDGLNSWPDIFRKMHFVSAVDYLHAARVRTVLMERMSAVFKHVDVYVGGRDLGICNLTGHPTVVVPAKISEGQHAQPVCGTLTAGLYDEATLLAVAEVVERAVALTARPAGFSD